MSEYINYITYSQIKFFNNGSRWKTDKVLEYYLEKKKIYEVTSKGTPAGEIVYQPVHLKKEDFVYKSVDFEPPIGLREWIAWGLLLVSIIANVLTAIFS